ncbi:MAG: pilus assembly protein [Cyanobacteria bacterium]|nr:pilus assembly protein [Cyanobacteriota bacterium]
MSKIVFPGNLFDTLPGQALLEMVLVLPVILFILLTTFAVGGLMYEGARVSSAMEEPTKDKWRLSNTPDSSATWTTTQSMITNYTGVPLLGLSSGSVDSLSLSLVNHRTAVLIGHKTVSWPLLPPFQFDVVSGVTSAVMNSNAGFDYAPYGTSPQTGNPSLYWTSAALLPAYYGLDGAGLPDTLAFNTVDCAANSVSFNISMLSSFWQSQYPLYTTPQVSVPPPSALPPTGVIDNPMLGSIALPMSPNLSGWLPGLTSSNTACNAPASIAQFQSQCALEGFPAGPAGNDCFRAKRDLCASAYVLTFLKAKLDNTRTLKGCSPLVTAPVVDSTETTFVTSGWVY